MEAPKLRTLQMYFKTMIDDRHKSERIEQDKSGDEAERIELDRILDELIAQINERMEQ